MKKFTRWVVYKYQNKINGKCYVGQTKDEKARRRKHKAARESSIIFHRAIKKYGFENFDYEIVDYAFTELEALAKESESIIKFNSLAPNGYNCKYKDGLRIVQSKELSSKISSRVQQSRYKRPDKYLGVFQETRKTDTTYYCIAIVNNKKYSKQFPSAEEAAEAYDKINLLLRGESALFNFPEKLDYYKKKDLKKFVEWVEEGDSKKISRYRYVGFAKRANKFHITYSTLGIKRISLGTFEKEIDAAIAADQLIIYFKLNKPLNFPGQTYSEEFIKDLVEKNSFQSEYYGVSLYKGLKKWLVNSREGRVKAFFHEKSAAIYHDWLVVRNNLQSPINFSEYCDLYRDSQEGEILNLVQQFEDQIHKPSMGVSFFKHRNKWVAYTKSPKGAKRSYIGYYDTEQEARTAREEYYLKKGQDEEAN